MTKVTHIFLMPLLLMVLRCCVLVMKMEATRWPRPSNRYLEVREIGGGGRGGKGGGREGKKGMKGGIGEWEREKEGEGDFIEAA